MTKSRNAQGHSPCEICFLFFLAHATAGFLKPNKDVYVMQACVCVKVMAIQHNKILKVLACYFCRQDRLEYSARSALPDYSHRICPGRVGLGVNMNRMSHEVCSTLLRRSTYLSSHPNICFVNKKKC